MSICPWTILGWILGIIAALFGLGGTLGCAGPGLMSTVTSDVAMLLDKPAVQATLDKWAAQADVTNPRLSFVCGTIFEVRTDGVIVRADLTGDAEHGIPPGNFPPAASQPASKP